MLTQIVTSNDIIFKKFIPLMPIKKKRELNCTFTYTQPSGGNNMLRDDVRKYTEFELQYEAQRELYHYCCAQAILYGANDYYSIGLDPKTMRLIIPFGAGMCTGNTCGMLTGGVAAIGALFAEEMPTQNLKLKEITRYWTEQFQREFQDLNCNNIKEINLKPDERCANLILKAADILEEVIEKYKADITM